MSRSSPPRPTRSTDSREARSHPRNALALALTLFLAPSGLEAQGYTSLDLNGKPVVRRCAPARRPSRFPPVETIVDTGAVLPMLRRDPIDAVISAGFSEAGTLTHLALLGGEGAIDTIGLAVRILRPHFLPQPSGERWAVRVHLSSEPTPTIRLERAIYCPPTRMSLARDGSLPPLQIQLTPGQPVPTGRLHTSIELTLLRDGTVERIEMVHSSGIPDFDEYLLRIIRGWRYFPALVDGVPVASWIRTDGKRLEY